MKKILKSPLAWVPILMSSFAFLLIIFYVAIFGIAKNTDEGLAARIFQLLLVGQLPIVAFFVLKYINKKPIDF